jgi:hypothetical protein
MSTAHHELGTSAAAALVAELNDLLQLDYDAVAAYAIALSSLDDPGYQDAVRRFKVDHERHIDELTDLVRAYGGIPLALPHVSGVFKTAVQAVSAAGNDAAIITAFKANEVQSRDKYRRAASKQHPPDVQGALIKAARDEQHHFSWAMRTLADLGVNTGSLADALEQMHARSADSMEAVERGAMYAAEYTRRSMRDAGLMRVAVAGMVLVGAAAAFAILRDRR